jgi:hypothetical protein
MLSKVQIDEYERAGFLRLQNLVPAQLLSKLDDLFEALLRVDDAPGKLIVSGEGGQVVANVDGLCSRTNRACLELLALPAIMEVAGIICGDDFFPIQEWAVIKHRGDRQHVAWHQDMVHRRKGRCFTMGVYLDDTEPGDGALRVVPGSHVSGLDICALAEQPFVEVPMKAGDALIHDMMLAHSSGPLQRNAMRRVIYFEFLSASHVETESLYPSAVVHRRTRLLFAAAQYAATLSPQHPVFSYGLPDPAPEDRMMDIEGLIQDIYREPAKARPSAYCLNGESIFSTA